MIKAFFTVDCLQVDNITRSICRVGFKALCIHGDKNQQDRDYVLHQFRQSSNGILVATDVAARGLGKSPAAPLSVPSDSHPTTLPEYLATRSLCILVEAS